MRSEESTETSLEALPEDDLPVEVRHHPMPWVLFGVSLLLLAVVGVLLARRANTEIQRAEHEKFLAAEADKGRLAAESQRTVLTARVAELEQQLKAAAEVRETLAVRVKTLEDAKAAADKAAAEAKAAAAKPAPPPPAKKPPPKKKKKKH